MNRVRSWFAAVGLVALAALPAAAQVQTGSILLRVADAQGSAVPRGDGDPDQSRPGGRHDVGSHGH